MPALGAIFGISSKLGYLLPAIIGLESMGVPSPGETALVLAAILASQHKLQIWLVIVIASASAIIGDNIGYWLGRKLGREVLETRGPFHEHRVRAIDAGDKFFKRHGSKAVFLGRWIALVRIATAWLAGINKMHFPTFFMWNALGGITWALTFGLAAYFGGHAAEKILADVGIVGGIVLAVVLVGGWVLIKLRARRAARDRVHTS
ncbi:MAG: DedA family protein [Solirubrobacterales bacterium]|nr:DedA family protein [Solirubrobacterales bacterium]